MSNFGSRLSSTSIVAGVALFALAGAAQSSTVFDNGDVAIYMGQNTFPSGLNEQKIFLNDGTGKKVTGTAGGTIVDFTSPTKLDAEHGFADITGKSHDYHDLTITVPKNFVFTDFLFSAQLNELENDKKGKKEKADLTITAYNDKTLLGGITLTKLKYDADLKFLVLAENDAVITSLLLHSDSGFDETKHFEISGLIDPPIPNPLPAAVWLFGTVLAGAAGVGKWRKRRAAVQAA